MPKPAEVLRLLRGALADPAARARLAYGLGAEFADVLEQLERCRAEAFRAMPYAAYLKTEHWQTAARRARERARHRCQLCNDGEKLDVHHRTYERLGHEEDEDLTVLCSTCHERFHFDPEQPQHPDYVTPPEFDEAEIEPINLLPEAEQIAWLQKIVSDKRRSMGIESGPLPIPLPSSTSSGA